MIDVDSVPPQLRATAQFRHDYENMLGKLKNLDFVRTLCAHEAAHVVFFEMMGRIRYRPLRSRLEFNPHWNRFEGHFAAIELIEVPACEPTEWQKWVTMWADANVAGGVVARKLNPNSTGGDEGDKEKFRRECAELIQHFGGITIDVEVCWRTAQRRVEQQLVDNPILLEKILQRADELRPQLGL